MGMSGILIVEDDPIDQKFITKALRNLGDNLKVVTVSKGADALRMLKLGYRPSLIITDLNMPEMDGHEFLATLKNNAKYRGIPRIVLSTADELTERSECFRKSAVAYIEKPATVRGYDFVAQQISGYCAPQLAAA